MGNCGSNLGMRCIGVKVMKIQWNELMQIQDIFQKKKMNKIFTRAESRDKISDTSDKRWKWEEEACLKGNEIHFVHSVSICWYPLPMPGSVQGPGDVSEFINAKYELTLKCPSSIVQKASGYYRGSVLVRGSNWDSWERWRRQRKEKPKLSRGTETQLGEERSSKEDREGMVKGYRE